MKTIASLAFSLLSTAAFANQYEKYVLVHGGNTWTFEDLGTVVVLGNAMQVRAEDLAILGFPGTREAIRVQFVGATLCVQEAGQWKPLLNFGVREGESYAIPDLLAFQMRNVTVTLVSKNEAVANPVLQETFRRCVHFRLDGRWGVESVPIHLYFSPNVGLVAWKAHFSAGWLERHLKTATVDGMRLGAVTFDSYASGGDSFYPGTNSKVVLIRNSVDLLRFYKLHRNVQEAPPELQAIDFNAKTILAVIGPVRKGLGRGVEIQGLFRDRRPGSARLLLHEQPLGPVLLPRPYEIVIVNGKIDRVRAEWR